MNTCFSQNGLRCSGGLSDPPRSSADMNVGEMTDGLAMGGVGRRLGLGHGRDSRYGRQRPLHAQLAGASPVATFGGPCRFGAAHVALDFAVGGCGAGFGAVARPVACRRGGPGIGP